MITRYIAVGLVEGEPDVDLLTEVYEEDDSNDGGKKTYLGDEPS